MTPEQFQQLNDNLKDIVVKTVNGKIDKLQAEQSATNIKIDAYIKDDNTWKESVTPSIEIMKSIQSFSKSSIFLMKTIILIGAMLTAIWGVIEFVKKIK